MEKTPMQKIEWVNESEQVPTPTTKPPLELIFIGPKKAFEHKAAKLIAESGLTGKVRIVWNKGEPERSYPEMMAKIQKKVWDELCQKAGAASP